MTDIFQMFISNSDDLAFHNDILKNMLQNIALLFIYYNQFYYLCFNCFIASTLWCIEFSQDFRRIFS